jgi:P27 family predicted phage terminase small subunit
MRGARPELRVIDSASDNLSFASQENGSDPAPFRSAEELSSADDSFSASPETAESPQLNPPSGGISQLGPPPALPAELAAEWRGIVADLKDRRLWKDSMASLVTSYVLAAATVLRLELQIAAEGAFVAGAGGASKPHPATGLLRSSRDTVARLGAELGLTPTARSRKAMQPAAQAPMGDLFNVFDV